LVLKTKLLHKVEMTEYLGTPLYASHTVNDVSAASGISSPYHALNFIIKPSFRCKFI